MEMHHETKTCKALSMIYCVSYSAKHFPVVSDYCFLQQSRLHYDNIDTILN